MVVPAAAAAVAAAGGLPPHRRPRTVRRRSRSCWCGLLRCSHRCRREVGAGNLRSWGVGWGATSEGPRACSAAGGGVRSLEW